MICIILLPIIIDARKLHKPHQDHEPHHVGLQLLYSDLGPGGKLFGSHALKGELVTLLDMDAKRAGVEKREKIPNGEGGTGTPGPAVSVNGGTLIHSSVDDHCIFAPY